MTTKDLTRKTDTQLAEEAENLIPALDVSEDLYQQLAHNCVKYTPDDKIRACALYLITGNSATVEKMTGIDRQAVVAWRHTPWWQELRKEIYDIRRDELDAELTQTIHLAAGKLKDKIEQGEPIFDKDGHPVLDPETGEQRHKPLTAHQLAVDGIAIPFEKRALSRGDPTSKIDRQSPAEALHSLKEEFRGMIKEELSMKTIEGEVIKDDEEVV